MSVTIDSLEIQIQSSAGSASSNIDKLANSLSKLRENAKLTTVTNNISKLSDALGKLQANSTNLGAIRDLANAMSALSGIQKASGLTSAVNTLKKIPEITKSLDTATLDSFVEKMKKLSSAIAPLATQLDSVGTAFNRLPSKIQQIVTGTNRMTSATKKAASAQGTHRVALDATNINMAAMVSNIQAYIAALQTVVAKIQEFMALAIEWDGIQARFGRAFGASAQESLAWVEKLSEGLMINKQEFMQHSSLFAEMLKGFGINERDSGKMAIGYTELAYDIWAAFNDVYKSLGGEEGAIAAVRSAIAGEVEPIRRAGFTIVDSQLAITAANHGLAYSTQKSTEAEKSYLRYLTLVDQAMARGIVGVYAAEMQTAEGTVRTLSQQFKVLAQTLGSLFLPILVKVVPYVTAFVQILTDAVRAVANFFGIELFKIDWSRGVGGLATEANAAESALTDAGKAAKALKNYTMGFDELNIISPSDTGSAGAAGAGVGSGFEGLDVGSLWDESIFGDAKKQVDEIKEKLKDVLTVVGLVGAGFLAWKIAPTLIAATNAVVAFIKALSGSKAASSALTFISPKLAAIVDAFFKLKTLTAPVWAGIAAAVILVGSAIYFLYKNWEEVTSAAKRFFAANIQPKIEKIKESFDGIKSALSDMIPSGVKEFFENIGPIFETIGGIVVAVVGGTIAGAFNAAVQVIVSFAKIIEGMVQIVSGVVQAVVKLFKGDLQGAWDAVKLIGEGIYNVFAGLVSAIVTPVQEFVMGVISWFTLLWDELVGHSIVPDIVNGIVEWFLSLPGKVLNPIKDFCSNILKSFKDLWTSTKSWWSGNVAPFFTKEYWLDTFNTIKVGAAEKLAEAKKVISDKWDEIKKWFGDNVAPKFTLSYWLDQFKNLKEGFTTTIKGMLNAGIDMMNRFINYLNSHLEFSWDAFEIAGKEIVPGGSIQLFTIPNIPRLADGGFVDAGQMFIAREAGPELVGRFGNRTAVANNDQIVAGVAAGVYEAVAMAMRESQGGGQAVNVYLDGKQIYASVKKTESERGLSLMGGQLGYSY